MASREGRFTRQFRQLGRDRQKRKRERRNCGKTSRKICRHKNNGVSSDGNSVVMFPFLCSTDLLVLCNYTQPSICHLPFLTCKKYHVSKTCYVANAAAMSLHYYTIVFVWSQLDGGKVEQKNNGISSRQNLMMP